MDYQKYIRSDEWKYKRKLRLHHDKYRCRTCGSTENLEVHHVTYENFGNEKLEDLLTMCQGCHEVITDKIRQERYKKHELIKGVETCASVFRGPDEVTRRIKKLSVNVPAQNHGEERTRKVKVLIESKPEVFYHGIN